MMRAERPMPSIADCDRLSYRTDEEHDLDVASCSGSCDGERERLNLKSGRGNHGDVVSVGQVGGELAGVVGAKRAACVLPRVPFTITSISGSGMTAPL